MEVQIIDERVDEADRIVAMNVVIDPRRQKLGLVAITTFNVVHATILANQLAKWNPRQPDNSRFHTVWVVFERWRPIRKISGKSGLNYSQNAFLMGWTAPAPWHRCATTWSSL
jgi:hypothetical protein